MIAIARDDEWLVWTFYNLLVDGHGNECVALWLDKWRSGGSPNESLLRSFTAILRCIENDEHLPDDLAELIGDDLLDLCDECQPIVQACAVSAYQSILQAVAKIEAGFEVSAARMIAVASPFVQRLGHSTQQRRELLMELLGDDDGAQLAAAIAVAGGKTCNVSGSA